MKINVARSSMPSYEEYCEAIKPIFESKWLTNMGPFHNEFADKVAARLGVDNVPLNKKLSICNEPAFMLF